jgi:mannosylglycerate hydrolase
MKKKYTLHVVSHTHWDREWYLTFQQFRLRLVDLMDRLLDILDKDKDYKYYLLDGQTVVLEDYLEIRPENCKKIAKYVKEGRIQVGPWFVLPDEFLVSGEALIRNLLIGHRIANEFGKVLKVGYSPDAFGHISQLPQILNGFDIDSAVLWRGFYGDKSECIWRAPEGSQVLLIHLPRQGYTNAYDIPRERELAFKKIIQIKEECKLRATTLHLLLMNGSDHVFPQPHLPKVINSVNEELDDSILIHSNLAYYINKIKECNPKLDIVEGEFRSGLEHSPLLTGVISTRMYLKQKNEEVQALLERWVEPISSFNCMLGGGYDQRVIRKAWEYLLKNHPHDSICGCSIDEVHRDMEARFSWVEQIANEVIYAGLRQIAEKIKRVDLKDDESLLVVFNPLNWPRKELVQAYVDFPVNEKIENFKLYNINNKEIICQIMEVRDTVRLALKPSHLPVHKPVRRFTISFIANVPACGYSAYRIKPVKNIELNYEEIKADTHEMESEYLKVKINEDGTLNILDKETNRIYKNLHYFEDESDAGDEYNFSPPKRNSVVTTKGTKAKIKKLADGPLLTKYEIATVLKLPKSLTNNRQPQSNQLVNMKITSFVTLGKRSKRIDVETVINNKAMDHRLRAVFPSGINTNFSFADLKFDVIKREIKVPEYHKNYVEKPVGTYPHDIFVDLNDREIGFAIISKGLPEFEVKDTKDRPIALTLLRCVGNLSRDDLLNRRGHAGYPTPTPDAQCLGEYEFKYAIMPHRGNWENGAVYKEALNNNVSMKAIQLQNHLARNNKLPKRLSFVNIVPDTLLVSAVKEAENMDCSIIRFYNIGSKKVNAKISTYLPIKRACIVNLNEEIQGDLKVKNDTISLEVGGKEIITLALWMGRNF